MAFLSDFGVYEDIAPELLTQDQKRAAIKTG